MKNFKNIFIVAGALALCSVGFSSCDDDDTYDFPGDSRVLVFAQGRTANCSVLASPIMYASGVDFSMKATANKPATGDIQVKYDVDNSLIDAYNEENETNYLPVPDGVIILENQTLTIPAGASASEESFRITLDESPEKLSLFDPAEQYIIPVRMVEANGGGASVSTSVNEPSYIVISISTDVIKSGEDTTDAGTEVTDFTGWTATCSTGEDVSAMLDGDYTNYCEIESDSPFDVTIDMGKEYSFGAIKGTYYYVYWGNWGYEDGSFPQNMVISISSNGTDWIELGTNPNGSSWSNASAVVFAGTVKARYIKLGIPVVNGWYGSSASFSCGLFTIFEK